MTISQGSQHVAKHALKFQAITISSEWNGPALKSVFHNVLNPEVVMQLACHDDQLTLDSLINLVIHLDHLI